MSELFSRFVICIMVLSVCLNLILYIWYFPVGYFLFIQWSFLLFCLICCKIFWHFYYYLFIYVCCTGSSLLCSGFLQLQRMRVTLGCGTRASHCGGFTCWRAQTLECRLSSCGSHGMCNRPRPGIKPTLLGLTNSHPLHHQGCPLLAFFWMPIVTVFSFIHFHLFVMVFTFLS